jgi:peptidylprolyl isomerase
VVVSVLKVAASRIGGPGGTRGRALRRGSVAGLAALVLAVGAACSSGSSGSTPAGAPALPAVSGAVGQEAQIKLPPGNPSTTYQMKTLVKGSGAALKTGEMAAVNFTAMNWSQNKVLESTYSTDGGKTPNQPQLVTLGSSSGLLPAWNTALTGAQIGSRIEVVAPPADAFGTAGSTQAGVGPDDVLVFVLDVVAGYPADVDITGTQPAQTDASLPGVTGNPGAGNPAVTIPKGVTPPTTLVANTLIHGSGETVAKGQTLIMQYTGVDWNTGKNFDSSFTRKQAFSVAIGTGQVIPGWDTGLVGKHVGDRVLLVVPPADGYGPQGGQPSAGIGAKDTLVFVVDIVDAL